MQSAGSAARAEMEATCFKRRVPCAIACIVAIGAFLLAFNLRLPALPYPLVGSLLPYDEKVSEAAMDGSAWWPYSVHVLLAAWSFHFIRRLVEVLFVHEFLRTTSVTLCALSPAYYGLFGLWIGWSMNYHWSWRVYSAPVVPLMVPALVMFVIGEIGNSVCHAVLRAHRRFKLDEEASSLSGDVEDQKPLQQRQISSSTTSSTASFTLPDECCFRFVTCPHYAFELISWVGFAAATCTLASLVFLVCNIAILGVLTKRRHAAYAHSVTLTGETGGSSSSTRVRHALIPRVL